MKICSIIKSQCSAHGKPQKDSEFRFFPVSERYSKTCNACRMRNAKLQTAWRGRNPEESRRRSSEATKKRNERDPTYAAHYARRHLEMNREMHRERNRKQYWAKRRDPVAWQAYLDHRKENRRIKRATRLKTGPLS